MSWEAILVYFVGSVVIPALGWWVKRRRDRRKGIDVGSTDSTPRKRRWWGRNKRK